MQLIQVLSKVVQKFLRQRKKLPNVNTLEDVIELLRVSKNIMVLTGAGVCNKYLFIGEKILLFHIILY